MSSGTPRIAADPYTASGLVVVLAAGASVFVDVGILTMGLSRAEHPSVRDAITDAMRLLPHAAIVGARLAGFRRTAGALALPTGFVVAFYASIVVLLTLEQRFATLAVLQVVMALAAFLDLRDGETSYFNGRAGRRMIGAAAGVVLWCGAAGMLVHRHTAEQQARVSAAGTAATNQRWQQQREATAWMSRSILPELMTLARCVERFRGDSAAGPPPRSLTEVGRWASGATAHPECRALFASTDSARPFSGFSEHSRVHYRLASGRSDPWLAGGYSLEAEAVWNDATEPVRPAGPGARSYLIDSGGAIHTTADHRRATLADDTLPACDPKIPRPTECAPYLARQRWGVTMALPTGSLSLGTDSIRVGDTAWMQLSFAPRIPGDSARSFVVDWGDGAVATNVVRPASASHGEQAFRLSHVFSDTGRRVIRAVVSTRDGSRHVFADTVRTYRLIRVRAVGTDARGRLVSGGTAAQARQALENVRDALAREGSSMDRLTRCDVRVADMGDASQVAGVFETFLPGGRPSGFAVTPAFDLPRGVRVQLDCRARPGP